MNIVESENTNKKSAAVIFYTDSLTKDRMEYLKSNHHINWSSVLRKSLNESIESLERKFRVKNSQH